MYKRQIKGNVIDFSVEVEVVKSFIEGYKACLAAQSQSVDGSKLPKEIYVTYDKSDGEVFCAYTSKEQCEYDAKDGGCAMQSVILIIEESGISEKPNNHIESLEKKLMQ